MGDGGRKWSDHGELRFLSGFFFFFFGFGVVWCESGFLDMVSYRRLLATVEAAVLISPTLYTSPSLVLSPFSSTQ